jgi:hypothetical protein
MRRCHLGVKKAWLTIIGAGLFLAPALVSSAYLFSILLCLFVFLWLKNVPARPESDPLIVSPEPNHILSKPL